MAWGNFILDKGFDAAAAITKFRAVKFVGNASPETVTPVTGIADESIGFAQFTVTAADILRGKGCTVRVEGVTEAEAVGAIAIGQRVTMEADGRVSAYVAASGKRVVGLCVGTPSTNAGDRIALLLRSVGPLA